jgi:hypothetical protein
MADLYRTRLGYYKPDSWKYGEGKVRPAAILSAQNVYNTSHYYPKGSSERAAKIRAIGFRCERFVHRETVAEWVDCTEEFL